MNFIVFPGQGSQKIGMGKELSENFVEAKHVFDEVNDRINFDFDWSTNMVSYYSILLRYLDISFNYFMVFLHFKYRAFKIFFIYHFHQN